MMHSLIHFIAQMDPVTDGTPPLAGATSHAVTWIIAGVLCIGILLVTFKTSKRNHLDRE